MEVLTPAGHLSQKDIRKLVVRGTTFASVSIVLYAAVMTYVAKHALKQLLVWHWSVIALPVVGFVLKKLLVYGFTRFKRLGVPTTDTRHPEVREFVRALARRQGLAEPRVVGIGSEADVKVSVIKAGPLKAVGLSRQQVIVKIGAPLVTTMTPTQLAIVISHHLAVVAEPFPVEASALIQRRDDFASTRAGTRKAARAEIFFKKIAQFDADINARAWDRAQQAANGSPEEAIAALDAARAAAASFAIVEGRLRTLLRKRKPVPAQFHNAWAAAWRSGHPMPPNQMPLVGLVDARTEKTLARQWTNLQTLSRDAMTMAAGLAVGSPSAGAGRRSRLVNTAKYDFSWLLAGIG
jgi:hypothetical protein